MQSSDKYDDEIDQMARLIATPPIPTTERTKIAIQSLEQFGVSFCDSSTTNWTNNIAILNIRTPQAPAILIYAQTAQNVRDAVTCGVAAGLKVSARCGGHSYASFGLGGEDGHLIVDLTDMNSLNVDTTTNIATAGAGARLGDVARGLYSQGRRAISHGSCPAVGISGHILHGGYGWFSHNKGLALDWMIGADVVLASGKHVHCSEMENADLFWGLRGAGSNFGIVTSYELKTFAAPLISTTYSVRLGWKTEAQKVNGLNELVHFARNMPSDLNHRCM